jgi:hypothetical protein
LNAVGFAFLWQLDAGLNQIGAISGITGNFAFFLFLLLFILITGQASCRRRQFIDRLNQRLTPCRNFFLVIAGTGNAGPGSGFCGARLMTTPPGVIEVDTSSSPVTSSGGLSIRFAISAASLVLRAFRSRVNQFLVVLGIAISYCTTEPARPLGTRAR